MTLKQLIRSRDEPGNPACLITGRNIYMPRDMNGKVQYCAEGLNGLLIVSSGPDPKITSTLILKILTKDKSMDARLNTLQNKHQINISFHLDCSAAGKVRYFYHVELSLEDEVCTNPKERMAGITSNFNAAIAEVWGRKCEGTAPRIVLEEL